MSDLDEQTRHARRAVLDAADMNPRLVDGLEELCEARRRAYRVEQVLEEDLSQVELVRDQLDEKAVRVKERRKDADKAQRDLDRLAAELGAEAFAAREVGDLAELSIFNERMQAQRQVDEWEGEITELGEAKGFGAVVKAKARQAQLLAKVTATKATFRGMTKDIGRGLVEEGTEELVRCDQTEVTITKIKSQKETLGELERLLNEANADFMKTASDAAERFGLERVSGVKDLDAAAKKMRAGVKQAMKDQKTTEQPILDRLDVAMSLGQIEHDSLLYTVLQELRMLRDSSEQ